MGVLQESEDHAVEEFEEVLKRAKRAEDIAETNSEYLSRELRLSRDREDDWKNHLRSVILEANFVMNGGDDPHDKCSECGCAGYGILRDVIHRAEKALAQ